VIGLGAEAALLALALIAARIGWRGLLRYRGQQHVSQLLAGDPRSAAPVRPMT
jgi:hypothetical protein